MAYKVSSKDFDELDDWIRTASAIKTIFRKLCSLEQNGLKNSSEYLKQIDYLEIALEVENKIVSKITPPKAKIWLKLLESNTDLEEFSQFNQNVADINVKSRLTNTLLTILDFEELEEKLSSILEPEEYPSNHLDYAKFVRSSMYSTIFGILRNRINNYKSQNLIEEFYALAYTIAFFNQSLISCKFDISPKHQLGNSKVFEDFFQVDENDASYIRLEVCEFFLREEDALLELAKNYRVPKRKLLKSLIKIIAEVVFTFLNEEEARNYIDYYSSSKASELLIRAKKKSDAKRKRQNRNKNTQLDLNL